MPSKLFFCIGSSHSGKSTYARKWVKEPGENPRVIVTTDNIRQALAGKRYTKDLETVVFSHKHIMLKTLLLEGFDVLACGTHTTRESIKRILEIDKDATPIVFVIPEEVCLGRMELTKQTNMTDVIKRHCRQLNALLDYGVEKTIQEIKKEIEIRWDK